ncbi:MAG: hypothetical protein HZC40_01025 [Chloroflexi bacterium]|nr:hypothetical protein [Chloroflexota bacterium]
MSNETLFDAVANRITVLEIAVKLFYALPSYDGGDVSVASMEAMDENLSCDDLLEVGLVRDGDKLFGRIYTDTSDYEKAEDVAEPITPGEMVAASTSILDLIPLFEKHNIFFVLDRNELTHWVAFAHLDKLPAKLCLFSLFLELELEMIRALTSDSVVIGAHLGHLSQARLEKARMLCNLKYKEETPYHLLLCTTFIDKKTMIQADSRLSNQLPFPSRNSQDRFFKTVEEMRNQIAHSDSIFSVINSPAEMSALIGKTRETLKALSDIRNP